MATRAGRRSIFRDKVVRVQGWLTKRGGADFERARQRLAVLAGWNKEDVSDSDVQEYLAIGETETMKYLKRQN